MKFVTVCFFLFSTMFVISIMNNLPYCWISGFQKAKPDEQLFKPCAVLDKLVLEGKLGVKTGQGFYSYDKNKK